jgi:hypothetical protein
MHKYKEVDLMSLQDLKSRFSWFKEQVRTVWSKLRDQRPAVLDNLTEGIVGFLTSPLGEVEYALLKRVSGIIGTAVAVYLTFIAGMTNALVVIGLCLIFSFGLYKISGLAQTMTS